MKSKIVFFDDYWLDIRKGVSRRWFKPQLISTYIDPVYRNGVYPSVQWCPEVGKYRLWYEVLPDIRNDALRYLASAESEDGLHWTPLEACKSSEEGESSEVKPGDPSHLVYKGNGGLHGTSVIRDAFESDPEKRYKAAGMTRTCPEGKRPPTLPVRLSTSPDGIHWKEQNILHPYTSDALNCLFFNPYTKRYSLLHRAAYVDRRVFLSSSDDLVTWNSPKLIVHPDAGYGEGAVQLYSMWGGWDEGMFLGFTLRYYVDMDESNYSTMNGYMDSELMYSYDGEYWMHTTREPIVERNLPGEFGHTQLSITGMTPTRDNTGYIIIATGSRFSHSTTDVYENLLKKYDTAAHQFIFYTIRKDGFAGLENSSFGGKITTKTIELLKPDLRINIAVPFGRARFALLDPDGEPYEGFSFDDSVPFSGDEISLKPRWKEKGIDELTGRRMRISVDITSGIIYSIQATMRPSIRVSQSSFGNGMQLEPERKTRNET